MKVLVVGLGSIGRRHVKNLKLLGGAVTVGVLRHRAGKDDLGEVKPFIDCVFFDRKKALRWKPDAALITNPAPFHVKTALDFACRGVYLFIEKPLSVSAKGIDELSRQCRRRRLVVMVGYNLRFFKPLLAVKEALKEKRIGKILYARLTVGQYLPDWRPAQDYRLSVSARKNLGGGAIFELSHEIDYLCWLFDDDDVVAVNAQKGHLSDLKIDAEDAAEITVRFDSGMMASIHLDMIDRLANRSCRIVGTEGTIIWDANDNHRVRLYAAATKSWTELNPPASLDGNEMYLSELRHFFDCIRRKKKPLVGIEDGRRVLKIALAAKRSSEKGKVIRI